MDDGTQSAKLMRRMVEHANKLGSHVDKRLGTLERLEIACTDILSGKAWLLADAGGEADNPFPHDRPRINYGLVGKYVRMRRRVGPEGGKWTGPTAEFIRSDPALKAYVDARRVEAAGVRTRRERSRRATSIEDALAKLPIEDRYLIRDEIDRGLTWKEELDLVREQVKKWKPVEVEELLAETGHRPVSAKLGGALDSSQADLLRRFVVRIRSEGHLDEFGLKYVNGSVKMSFAPGRTLIAAEEMAAIASVAGFPL